MTSPAGTGHRDARRYAAFRLAGCAVVGFVVVAATAVGCSGGKGSEERNATSVTPVPAPSTSTPEEDCRRLVEYWARAMIQGNRWSGLDWEQKGFSIDQHMIHERIVAAARDEQRAHGTEAALQLIGRQARQECTARHGALGGGRH
ncbi:hypothetical protein ACFVYD_17870 [Streptomyces sp. NPDC058301]|uniref:hypothetical protein n=1 Tax=Streptomyces sp. NPDC058301 TaxID=3346436 RepID=UPI0036F0218F